MDRKEIVYELEVRDAKIKYLRKVLSQILDIAWVPLLFQTPTPDNPNLYKFQDIVQMSQKALHDTQ